MSKNMIEKNNNKNKRLVNKTKLAHNLGIGRSSLYYKHTLPIKDLALKKQIEKVLKIHKSYGHKRIALHLGINKKRASRVMKLFNLSPLRQFKKPIKKEDLKQQDFKMPNLVIDTDINKPNQIWSSDFTYLPYLGKFLYLATILDCFTKEIIGWSLSTKHNTEFIENALNDALAKRNKPEIFHSDQGSEYKSKRLMDILKSNNIKQSMSKKASPWQNGFQESFYGKFKLELGHPESCANIGELAEMIAHQIYYYNNDRIHTAIKCPPFIFYKKCQRLQLKCN